MYISELAQEDLIEQAKKLLPSGAAPVVEKVVEEVQKYRAKKKSKVASPPAKLTTTELPPTRPTWVVPAIIGTVVVGGLGITAWLLLRKKGA